MRRLSWPILSVIYLQVQAGASSGLVFVMLIIGDGQDMKWSLLMLSGPLLLVLGFVVVFWAARGVKALEFLATYKVKDVLALHRAREPVQLRPAAAA